jgi:hypothetical protein
MTSQDLAANRTERPRVTVGGMTLASPVVTGSFVAGGQRPVIGMSVRWPGGPAARPP